MRRSEIRECLEIYRSSADAYCALIDRLTAVEKSLEGLPFRPAWRREAVERDLECLGAALSVVPELVERLEEEVRLRQLMRQQAARAGVIFRYDLEPSPEPERDDEVGEAEILYGLGELDGMQGPEACKELLKLSFLDLEDFE